MAKEMQGRDQFDDVIALRMNATADAMVNQGPGSNRINILDFTPREKVVEDLSKKKKKVTKKVVLGIEEEEEDPNFDEFLADYEKKKKE